MNNLPWKHLVAKKDLPDIYDETKNMCSIFETRNGMITHVASKIIKPAILEIGVFRGEFLDYIVQNCDPGLVDAVDLFQGITESGDVDGNDVIKYDVGKSYLELSDKYKHASNIKIIKSDSSTFLKSQPDNFYDMIYIDGDHTYNGVKNDLLQSFLKIKNGGYIMGHDYELNLRKAKIHHVFGVKKAVDEFCASYKQTLSAKGIDGCVSYCIKINKI
jgi:hypothetical protein